MSSSAQKQSTVLLAETLSKRKLPVNFHAQDAGLFNHELEKMIPQTTLLELSNVHASPEGILFKGLSMLPESFAFPANMKQWKRRGILKFFVNNHALRRERRVESPALWIIDDWSYGYFHWLADALARLYVMRHRLDDLVLLLPWNYETPDFVQSSLRPFGVKAVDYIQADEVVRCRRMVLPTHTAPSGHYNQETIRGVRNVLLQAYGDAEYQGTGERIYISRARAAKRRISNEEALVHILAEFGFETVYAEDLSFEEQIKLCSRARYLVSNHGAGLTNMLFMPHNSSILELRHQSDGVNNCYFTLSSALQLNYFYQRCLSQNPLENPHTADLLVDPTELRKNINLLLGS